MAVATAEAKPDLSPRDRFARVEQGYLVLALTVLLCLAGVLTTDGFLTGGNLGNLLRLSAAFGILAVGETLVILGKGIDLSVAGVALGCAQATLAFMADGMPEGAAIALLTGLALAVGLLNGILVAYLEVPALFATLATGLLTIGGIDMLLLDQNFYSLPDSAAISRLGDGSVLGVPRAVVVAGAVFLLAWLFVSRTSAGRLIRAMGDNFATARSSGAPVRPLRVLGYVVSAVLAVLAGYTTVAVQGSAQTTVTSFDPLLFTALTVVVIGGVSLSGGRGTLLGVLAGVLFVGVLNNLLILRGLSAPLQDLVRGGVLVAAIALDAWLHPRDEETARTDEL